MKLYAVNEQDDMDILTFLSVKISPANEVVCLLVPSNVIVPLKLLFLSECSYSVCVKGGCALVRMKKKSKYGSPLGP